VRLLRHYQSREQVHEFACITMMCLNRRRLHHRKKNGDSSQAMKATLLVTKTVRWTQMIQLPALQQSPAGEIV
jgi:hypothetical protein